MCDWTNEMRENAGNGPDQWSRNLRVPTFSLEATVEERDPVLSFLPAPTSQQSTKKPRESLQDAVDSNPKPS